jgi:hypothetical protein
MRDRLRIAALVAAATLGCDPAGSSTSGSPPADPAEPLRPVAERGTVPEAARVCDWIVAARLDGKAHRIEGTATLAWTHRGPAPIESIPFHLYLNGFRSEDTAWMQAGLRSRRTGTLDPDGPWGFVDVTSVTQRGRDGEEPTALRFAERDEPSLMDVWLAAPLQPGETVVLELSFTAQLPRVFARTGYAGEFHMVGQWLPVPGVLDAEGQWHAHPFTLYSEFFADFGRWDVSLDVPSTYVVGATGTRTESWVDGDRRHERWVADMVHNFAWAAGPNLVEQVDVHDGVRIRQIMPPELASHGPEHLAAQVAALDSMQARFGPYPWSTLTIVHPPEAASGAFGMEYPTLFTTAPRVELPGWLQGLGFRDRYSGLYVTVHEFGHQYFQGLLASDEAAEPWLDEGMNSMSNVLAYHDWFASEPDPWVVQIAGQPLHLSDGARLRLRGDEDLVAIDTPAEGFAAEMEVYGTTVYSKTAAVMLTLREIVGHAAFDRAMKRYAEDFRFRHPTGEDLKRVLVEEIGTHVEVSEPGPDGAIVLLDVRDFLDRALETPAAIDYAVFDAGNRRRAAEGGIQRDEGGVLGEPTPLDRTPIDALPDEAVEGVAVVRRRGELRVPVEIEAELQDGTRERVTWDGRGTHVVLRWPGRRLRRVTVDPDRVLHVEGRRWNNTAYAPGATAPFSVGSTGGDVAEAIAIAILGGVGP